MSVVVAMKRNGVVYMGADTLLSHGDGKEYIRNEQDYKIRVTKEGLLVGITGNVNTAQQLFYNDVFRLDGNKLSMRYIVREIITKLIDVMNRNGTWEEKRNGELNTGISILLAHEDKLYLITQKLSVIALNGFGCIGAGEDYAAPILELGFANVADVNETLLKAMRMSSRFSRSVGAPYTLINTKDLKYTIEE